MIDRPDPATARTPAEFVEAMRRLKRWSGMGFRRLEQRAFAAGDALPRSTLTAALTRDNLPREDLVAAFARTCGCDKDEVERWVAARRRIAGAPTVSVSVGMTRRVAQLPPAVAGFTGRSQHVAALNALLAGVDDPAPRAAVITAIAGTPGVGKTALAVHWGHQVADRFPDGQLYVNLRGFDPTGTVMSPAEGVRALLDAFEMPPRRIPASLDAQLALYRSLLADKRMLVVLDNARDTDQVRPLLPGTAGCFALVTSRNQLTGLVATHGARPINLDLLSAAESRELLAQRLGADRLAAEPEAVEEIIAGCARLPLALAIVAARAALNPHFPLGVLAQELRDRHNRLDALDAGDPMTNVRAVFSWSYQYLTKPAARLFRLLGLHPGPDIGLPAAASLAGSAVPEARHALVELARAHLVSERAPGRYLFHDLLRNHATEMTRIHDTADERRAATHRMLDHYRHTAQSAVGLLTARAERVVLNEPEPGVTPERLTDHDQVLAWFNTERAVLLKAIELAGGSGFDVHTWQLALSLKVPLARRGLWHEYALALRPALEATLRLGDRKAETAIRRMLGDTYTHLGRFDDANGQLRRALELCVELGDQLGEGYTNAAFTVMYNTQDRPADALIHAQRALALYQAAGHRIREANAFNAVGWSHALLGNYEQALAHCEQALVLLEELGDRYGLAHTLDSVGYAHHHLGHRREAVAYYQRSVDLYRELGDEFFEAVTLTRLGELHLACGELAAARDSWQRAAHVFTEQHHPDADKVLAKLAHIPTVATP